MLGHGSRYGQCRLAMTAVEMLLVVLLALSAGAAALDSTEVPRERQEEALEKLQQVFGLEKIPHGIEPQVPPQFMTALYKSVADSNGVAKGRSPYNAKVVRSFIERDNSQSHFFTFNISGLQPGEKVLEAEFHLFRRSRGRPTAPNYLIRVFQVLNESRLDNPDYHRLLSVRPVNVHTPGWEVFNVTAAVMNWVSGRSANKGLLVTTTDIFGEPVEVNFARRNTHHNSKQPILVLFDDDGVVRSEPEGTLPHHPIVNYPNYYQYKNEDVESNDHEDSSEHRDRRSILSQEKTSDNSSDCTLRSMFVDFDKIGWGSWIVAPRGYDAYYCHGSCDFPMGQNQKPSNHATVQSLVREVGIYEDVGKPCCVPEELKEFIILFLDEGQNVILKNYVDMVATSCGCY